MLINDLDRLKNDMRRAGLMVEINHDGTTISIRTGVGGKFTTIILIYNTIETPIQIQNRLNSIIESRERDNQTHYDNGVPNEIMLFKTKLAKKLLEPFIDRKYKI